MHVASGFYAVDRFVEGEDHLHGFEPEELGDVSGKRIAHLQCHFGMDTLSLARRGALVTGVDFSAPAVAEATALASRLGIEARFVEANVYDAVEALGDTYDVVYTGKGALNWIPDLAAWGRVVAALLQPGGFLYLTEYHPLSGMLDDDGVEFEWPYFNTGPEIWDDGSDYADPEAVLEACPHRRVGASDLRGDLLDHRRRLAARVLPRVRRDIVPALLVHGGGRPSALQDARRQAGAPAHVLDTGSQADLSGPQADGPTGLMSLR